ncbi:MAG: cadherin-like domain-containing protein, partial [Rubripirellula sp.]|nr:cadherin-like domain-containing protein [Rubripirellula sp.]
MTKGSLQPKQRRTRRRRLRVECLGQRRLLAAITGTVFEDANHSSQREVGELNAPQRLIYIDANDNAALDADERFVVGETDGTFEFDGLTDGDYLVRLFNGTSTQSQTTPLSARIEGAVIAESGVTQILPGVASPLALTDQSLVIGDPTSGQSQLLPVGNDLTKMQTLPDGRVLAIGTDTNGPTSWVIDPLGDTVTPLDFSGSSSKPWSELAIDGSGRGVLLDVAIGQSVVRSVDASDPENAITSVVTNTTVPTDTQVITSSTGNRSVFAWNGSDGLQASLWSNASSSFITSTPFELNDSSDLLTFDDASGLLAARNTNGGVTIYDVDANFAALHTLDNVTGPVVIDGARELLLAISPIDTALRIINLRDGTTVTDLALDLSAIGAVSSVALAPEKLSSDKQSDVMVVLGTTGFAEIVLDRSTAHEITVADGITPAPILFGVAIAGSNVTPEYEVLPSFQTKEDSSLWTETPGALRRSFDADGDNYALVQLTPASHGSVTARSDGSFLYVPNRDFNGIDFFKVALHDGRDISDAFDVQITVIPVPDSPQGIILDLPPISELVLGGSPVGTIEIIDADGGGHNIVIDDPRFVVEGDDIIFVGGEINFQDEPEINLTISVTDLETDDRIEKIFAAQIREESAILEINPDTAEVIENQPGETVVSVSVTAGQNYALT